MDDDLEWYHLAICQGMKTNWFYDDYEADPVFAKTMDDICLSCPVRKMCLREGVENREDGLWGGVFLDKGKTDKAKNAHKTEEVWDEIRENI
jgi:hypothetical protein